MKMIWVITNKCNLRFKHWGKINLKHENFMEKIKNEELIGDKISENE